MKVFISPVYIPSSRAVSDASYYNDVQSFLSTRQHWLNADENARVLIEREIPYFAKTIVNFRCLNEETILQNIRSWM